jgi:mono/diheme cytochrome c family protein
MRIGARLAIVLIMLVAGAAGALWLIRPQLLPASLLKPRTADLANGEAMFNIGGCASCHARPGQPDRLLLGGGLALKTMFGTFKVPNISSHPTAGIGGWSELAFVNAMLRGVGAVGEHLYPAFPYSSYQRMALDDVRDLYAFLKSVPADARPSEPHQLSFPFNLRLALGGWKLMFLDGKGFSPNPNWSDLQNRGAYLVEGPGHCAECHSPRNILGGIIGDQRFAGGASPDGKGWVPNITPHADGLSGWTAKDMEFFLQSGFTPDGRSVDPEMAAVIANTSKLKAEERSAMAAYLVSLPARPGKPPRQPQ